MNTKPTPAERLQQINKRIGEIDADDQIASLDKKAYLLSEKTVLVTEKQIIYLNQPELNPDYSKKPDWKIAQEKAQTAKISQQPPDANGWRS